MQGAGVHPELRDEFGGEWLHARPGLEVAAQVVRKLIDLKVDAIIGPTTSSMAMAALPLINAAGVVMIAPTVSTRQLSGIDDYFFRVVAFG